MLKAIRESLLLVSTQATGLIYVATFENAVKNHAGSTTKGIMELYPECTLYTTTTNFDKVYYYPASLQKLCEAASASIKSVHVKDKHYSYLSSAKANNSDSSVNAAY